MIRVLLAGVSQQEASDLLKHASRYFAQRNLACDLVPVYSEKQLWEQFAPGRFQGAVIGLGDTKGFLCARRMWEADRRCRVVLIDDTDRYAIAGFRIHLADFLLRPYESTRLDAALDRMIDAY